MSTTPSGFQRRLNNGKVANYKLFSTTGLKDKPLTIEDDRDEPLHTTFIVKSEAVIHPTASLQTSEELQIPSKKPVATYGTSSSQIKMEYMARAQAAPNTQPKVQKNIVLQKPLVEEDIPSPCSIPNGDGDDDDEEEEFAEEDMPVDGEVKVEKAFIGSKRKAGFPKKAQISQKTGKKTVLKKKPVSNGVAKARNTMFLSNRHIDCSIPRACFQRVVKGMFVSLNAGDKRITADALYALQEVAEDFLVNWFSDLNIMAMHAKRVTIMTKDVAALNNLRQYKFFA